MQKWEIFPLNPGFFSEDVPKSVFTSKHAVILTTSCESCESIGMVPRTKYKLPLAPHRDFLQLFFWKSTTEHICTSTM